MPFDAIRRRVADYVLGDPSTSAVRRRRPVPPGRAHSAGLENGPDRGGFASNGRLPLPSEKIHHEYIQQHMARETRSKAEGGWGVINTPDFTEPPYRDRWLAIAARL